MTMRVKTTVKAGTHLSGNGAGRAGGLKVKTGVKAGGIIIPG